jgi:hypothetical protein
MKCSICETEFVVNPKSKSHNKNCCSYKCYRKTTEYSKLYKTTFIKNFDPSIITDNLSYDEIVEIFHKLKSDSVNRSQELRIRTIKNKGENEFSRMGSDGNRTRKKKFLIENKIIMEDSDYSQEQISRLFSQYFNSISGHGNKIKSAINKKYGNKTKEEFRRRREISFNKFINEKCDTLKATDEDIQTLRNSFNKKNAYKDVEKWKISNLKNNLNIDCTNLSKEEIDRLYSQYIIDRMNLVDSTHNGYKKTQKGYYQFINLNIRFFFRSSWEKCVLETLDTIAKNHNILVQTPSFIYYHFNGLNRKYYPDIEIIYNNKIVIIEIKPKSKIKDLMNEAKFLYANAIFENFVILTEEEIFSPEFNNMLLEIII